MSVKCRCPLFDFFKVVFQAGKENQQKSSKENGDVKTHLGHAAINDEIGPVHKTALIASEEDNGLGLLDGFAEAASWKMHFAALSLGYIVAEPVLEERRAVVGS